jgi:acetylornithine deacetylase
VDVYRLTRALVDIPSVTEQERAVGEYLLRTLQGVAGNQGKIERLPVTTERFNVLAIWGDPRVTLSTHMDTVPPFFPSREDNESIWGRGACDAKGIIAAMICAAEQLVNEGVSNFALLFVVGEERNSAGAFEAAKQSRGSKFLINGEPTENKLAVGSKGGLRYEIVATGRMAHSAYPELGESAINKLLDALAAIREIELPRNATLGASTLNIGTISGGRAPNVIADSAQAEVFIRLVDDGTSTRAAVARAAARHGVEAREVLCVPAMHLETVCGLDTTVVAFTTDIPAFDGSWGRPLLIGPGSIHVAHTEREHIRKRDLDDAVAIYKNMVRQLQS